MTKKSIITKEEQANIAEWEHTLLALKLFQNWMLGKEINGDD